MPNVECGLEVGCDNYNLMDRKEDGSTHHFIRKICKDMDGNISSLDLELDGSTEYLVEGDVFPSMPDADGNCAATVVARDMWDLSPKGRQSVNDKHCATPFLRHMVYDCKGNVDRVYDTERDGVTSYAAAQAIYCTGGGGGLPSLVELEWPHIVPVEADDDNGAYQRFKMGVKNPQTNEVGYIYLDTVSPSPPYDPNRIGCGRSINGRVAVDTPGSTANWRARPSNDSRFTFTTDSIVRNMSSLRLDFNDLDTFEGVWGLDPWPDYIVDSTGREDTFEVDIEKGAIHPFENDRTVFAYYFTIPDVITHLYHNSGGGRACHSANFTGYTYVPGPCCDCCADDTEVGEPGEEDVPYVLTTGFKKLLDGDAIFTLPPAGSELVSVRVNSLRGAATVNTALGSSTLSENTEASWEANDPKASLGPITVLADDMNSAEINVSWVARPNPASSGYILDAGFKKLRDGDPNFTIPPTGYQLISVRVNSLRGAAAVTTASGTSTLPESTEASWEVNGPKASLGVISVLADDINDAEINVSWVAKRI